MFHIGHTAITWGGDTEAAYRDVAELGYGGFETFGDTILEWNKKPGGYRALQERSGIPTVAAYSYAEWLGNGKQRDIELAERHADALKAVGGSVLVLQAGQRLPGGYRGGHYNELAEALNQVGRYCRDIGLKAGLHPHIGTAIERTEEIDEIASRLEWDLVGLAPDTGQISKIGGDIISLMTRYRRAITHIHLKDWNGFYELDSLGKEIDRSGYVNHEPIGRGVLPINTFFELLEGFDGWINVELDPGAGQPRPPREAAAMSRRYLSELLGDRVAWPQPA